MSNSSLLRSLEKLFLVIGIFSILAAILGVGFTVYTYQHSSIDHGFIGQIQWPGSTDLLPQFKVLLTSLSEAFLAFLVSSIFAMIRTQNPGSQERTDRLMHLTCGGYALTGIISLGSWIHWMWIDAPSFQCFGAQDCEFMIALTQNASLALMGFTRLTPFIYAITVYALYTQVARLVNFEAEVI